jgi:hypothetical protein
LEDKLIRQAVIGGALATVGILASYVITIRLIPHPAPSDPKTRAATAAPINSPAPNGETRTRLDFLESQLSALRARLEGVEAAPTAAQEARNVAAPEAPAPVSPEEVARQKAVWHEHMLEVEAGYQTEVRDPRWAREAQESITRALANLPTVSKGLRSLECRSETCRLEVTSDHQPEFQKELPLLPLGLQGLPSAQFDQQPEPDGKERTVVYFSRQTGDVTSGG